MPLLAITISITIKRKDKEANLRSGPLSPARTDRREDGSSRGTVSGTTLATRSASELGPPSVGPAAHRCGTGHGAAVNGARGGEGGEGERRGRRMGGTGRAGGGNREGGR